MNQLPSHPNMESIPVTTSASWMGNLAMPTPASSASHIGQATAIEQSRAAAEVQSAIIVAQRFPRNEHHALGRIVSACSRLSLAREAFYSFPRGGESITGVSIKLARELARSWGNIQYEIVELSQDLERGESEVMAYAWDLETNTRSAIRFIVPHKRHTKNGDKKLSDPRDIYELIANNGARRLRQCVLAVMPADVVTEAERVCRDTLQKGDGLPLDKRIKKCLAAFQQIGVTREMMAERLSHEPESMSIDELTDLQIIFQSIKAGELVEEFFQDPKGGQEMVKPESLQAKAQRAEPTGSKTKRGTRNSTAQAKTPPANEEEPILEQSAQNVDHMAEGEEDETKEPENPMVPADVNSTNDHDDMF